MNSSIEVAKFEPVPTFKSSINEIKDDHFKSIASTAMDLSAITLFGGNIEQLSINSRIELAKFEPEPTFENTINYIKANHLKSIISIEINVSYITLKNPIRLLKIKNMISYHV